MYNKDTNLRHTFDVILSLFHLLKAQTIVSVHLESREFESRCRRTIARLKASWAPRLYRIYGCHAKVGWLVVLRINVDLAIFQSYLDLEAGDNQSLKIQVERPGIEPRSSCSARQELNHSATAAPVTLKTPIY